MKIVFKNNNNNDNNKKTEEDEDLYLLTFDVSPLFLLFSCKVNNFHDRYKFSQEC